MSNRPARGRSRLAALDGLRLVAALAVLAYHYTGINLHHWGVPSREAFPRLNELTRYGYLGVELFFVISGFVILMTAYGRSVQSFSASRVARLFPAYWVAIVLTVVLQHFWDGGRSTTWWESLVNLTMIQDAYNIPHIQGAFWTLWYELKFYLLIGVFMLVGITRPRVIAFAVLWPLVGQIAAATDNTFLESLLIPEYAPYFAAGMLMYILHRDGRNVAALLGLAFNFVLCVNQAVGYSARTSELTAGTVSPVVVALAVAAMFAAVIACTQGPLARLQWRWLTVAGVLTYPLYLVHGQFGFFAIDVLHNRLPPYVTLAVATVGCMLLAYTIHRLVERPLAPGLRRAVQAGLEEVRREPAAERRRPDTSPAAHADPLAEPVRMGS